MKAAIIILLVGLACLNTVEAAKRHTRKRFDPLELANIKLTGLPGMYQGTFSIVSKNSGLVWDIYGASGNNGAKLIQYHSHGGNNQVVRIIQNSDGWYWIQFVHSGKVLDVPGQTQTAATQVQQWDYNGSDAQKWRFENIPGDTGKGWGKWMFIRAKCSNQVLDVNGASTGDAAAVIQYPQKGSGIDNQVWSLVEINNAGGQN